MAKRQWSWAYWPDDRHNKDYFGLRENDGSFKEPYIRRLDHPYARRIPGPLETQSWEPAPQTYRAAFRWSYDAPLELWTGTGKADERDRVTVAPADSPEGRAVDCRQAEDRPAGVWTCPVGPAVSFGATYEIRMTRKLVR